MIVAEVVLVSRKSDRDMHRWVYLSIGRFSGLAETEGEAIRYQFVTPRDGDATGPCIMAGPSCDSADVLYEKRPMQLPLTLKSGDRILIRNTGAYTSTYSSVCFNGFPRLTSWQSDVAVYRDMQRTAPRAVLFRSCRRYAKVHRQPFVTQRIFGFTPHSVPLG